MKNKSFKIVALALFTSSVIFTSCKKEDDIAIEPQGETILFIKAVRTDSTVLESERVVLR
ncbi:MAG TPA: hypothetical protein PK504_11205 [Ferruginibacter sp.]|nr:hypothetical protein [Ferruginibacter sp.]HRE63929.1 hypothetical protein [Ferruginibacter sp.]